VERFTQSSSGSRRTRALAAAWLAGLATLLAAYAVVTIGEIGSERVLEVFGRWVYDAIVLGAAAACLARAALTRTERGPWLALGAGLLLWALGQTYYSVFLYYASPAPFPSPSDAFFLAFYPASYVALVLLLRARAGHLERLAWVDGLIGALAVAAVAAALIFPPVLDALGHKSLGVAVSLAYPVADLVLLGFVVGALAASEWRARGTWLAIAGALLLFAASDVVYLWVGGQSTQALNIASVGWPLAFLILAAAAWMPARPVARTTGRDTRRIALPVAFATAGVSLLVLGTFVPISATAVALAAASLVAVLARLAVTFSDNLRMLAVSRHEALTDALTGLGNRRKLMNDLPARIETTVLYGEPLVLAIFDLDGFKLYNDSFGHASGDALLRRLGRSLATATRGRDVYRLGGDEFCVLVEGTGEAALAAIEDAAAALRDHGEGFSIDCSYGTVEVPDEASDVSNALRVADQRMYRAKQRGRASASRQSTDVLLRVLDERSPDLGDHLRDVSRLALAVGERMGLDPDSLTELAGAAELHDVGKLAIPDAILAKPGPLEPDEEEFLRQHTLIGERIVNAAPALAPVGHLVRACAERFDGSGVPDGLRGDEIPLAARIVAACDAFDAMISSRSESGRQMTPAAATAELRRGSGTRFDPAVVQAVELAWNEGHALGAASGLTAGVQGR
jgi:two-component system, cell cycle response regulator